MQTFDTREAALCGQGPRPLAVTRHLRHLRRRRSRPFDQQELDDDIRRDPATYLIECGYTTGINTIEPERMPLIVEALLRLGYGDTAVRGILGQSNLRVARAVWR